jgi:hypothetical protein
MGVVFGSRGQIRHKGSEDEVDLMYSEEGLDQSANFLQFIDTYLYGKLSVSASIWNSHDMSAFT